ncbi:MAG: hypothetical protein KDB53_10370 [Planctomycetes bacterium]|nr:hypothetical protein [Planctomycetota bacterium]
MKSLRATLFAMGLAAVFAALVHVVWVESRALAVAFELRERRERDGELENHERVLDKDIAYRTARPALMAAKTRMGLDLETRPQVPQSTVVAGPHTEGTTE